MKRDQASECTSCGSEERWLLHNVRHRGIYHRLCTSCVLKFHPGLFCPICFEFYEGPQPSNERVMCLKCTSLSHLACVSLDVAPRYVCPTCLNPSFSFFDLCSSNKRSKGADGEPMPAEAQRAIDHKSAKVLVVATRLASISMNKAANTARVEAEKRAKEAALAKKRAREALVLVSSIVTKEQEKKEKGKGMTGVPGSTLVMEQKKKAKGNGAISASLPVQKRVQNHLRTDGKDKAGGFPTPLNNASLREKERRAVFQAPNVPQGLAKNGAFTKDDAKLEGSTAPGIESQQIQNPGAVNERDMPNNLPQKQNHAVQGEKEKKGLFPVPTVAETLQLPQNSHLMDEGRGNSKGFVDSEIDPLPLQSNQAALVPKTNSGVLLTGSSNTTS